MDQSNTSGTEIGGDATVMQNDVSPSKFSRLTEFESHFCNSDEEEPVINQIRNAIKQRIVQFRCKEILKSHFPIVDTLYTYDVKSNLLNDLVAGLTAGVMMIPQGMAYASLSTLPPIVGLYISFFSSVTYFFLGTGRQLSWGCIAILSLMMANVLDKYDGSFSVDGCRNGSVAALGYTVLPNITSDNTNTTVVNSSSIILSSSNITESLLDVDTRTSERIRLAGGVSVFAGLILIVASKLGLSWVTSLMSNSVITGFTVGVSFHVATSQIKSVLGLIVPRYRGIASLVKTWIAICSRLPETNIASLVVSVICIIIIYVVKKFINEKFKHKLRAPVPIELFVLVVATLISYFSLLHDNFGVKIVKEVPIGLPPPALPNFVEASKYLPDALVIMIVAYAQNLAMAKIMGLKHNYPIDANQEMLASGSCSIVCGVFSGYICGASVSRSFVQDGAGGRTQLACLVSAIIVLLVIMVMGPYFYYLPICVLASIILVSLKSIFLKLLEIRSYWRKSRYDCVVWVFSCIATVILSAEIGLLASVVFSLLLVIFRSMLNPVLEAGQIQANNRIVQLRSVARYASARTLKNVKIVKIKTPIYYINAEVVVKSIFEIVGIDPVSAKKSASTPKNGKTSKSQSSKGNEDAEGKSLLEVKYVILDASEVGFVDVMGIDALTLILVQFKKINIEVLFSSIPENIIPMLQSTGFWKKHGDCLFVSLEAALDSIAEPLLDSPISNLIRV